MTVIVWFGVSAALILTGFVSGVIATRSLTPAHRQRFVIAQATFFTAMLTALAIAAVLVVAS